MPRYGRHRYGRIKYGKYQLSTGGGGGQSLGPHVQYRIRTSSSTGKLSEFITMYRDRISIPSSYRVSTRMRSKDGEWVYTQNENIQADIVKTRIRSIATNGIESEWVYADRGHLK